MDKFEIWSEGCIKGRLNLHAYYHGCAYGINFKDACINLAYLNSQFRGEFNSKELTFFNCRLFDNEKQARKKNG